MICRSYFVVERRVLGGPSARVVAFSRSSRPSEHSKDRPGLDERAGGRLRDEKALRRRQRKSLPRNLYEKDIDQKENKIFPLLVCGRPAMILFHQHVWNMTESVILKCLCDCPKLGLLITTIFTITIPNVTFCYVTKVPISTIERSEGYVSFHIIELVAMTGNNGGYHVAYANREVPLRCERFFNFADSSDLAAG